MIGMLVKVGDIWIDPLAVDAVSRTYVGDDGDVEHGVYLWTGDDSECFEARDITADEAVQIINRCREQHMNEGKT